MAESSTSIRIQEMSKNDMLNILWNRKNIYHWEMVASPLHIGKYGYTYINAVIFIVMVQKMKYIERERIHAVGKCPHHAFIKM